MSLVPNSSYSSPGVPLWTPAGGGSSPSGPNLDVSTITGPAGSLVLDSTGAGGGVTLYGVLTNIGSGTNINLNTSNGFVNISSLVVSSINNAPPNGSVGADIQLSTITGPGLEMSFGGSSNAYIHDTSTRNYMLFSYGVGEGVMISSISSIFLNSQDNTGGAPGVCYANGTFSSSQLVMSSIGSGANSVTMAQIISSVSGGAL